MMRTRLAGSSNVSQTPALRIERHLRRRPDRDLVALPLGDDRAWLDGCGMAAVGNVPAGDDVVGFRHARFDIALGDRRERCIVAIAHQHIGGPVRRPLGVHQRRIGCQSRLEIGDNRQWLELDDDRIDGLLGDRRGGRSDRGDDLALESHYFAGEQRAVLHERPEADVGHVVGGQHSHHAWDGAGSRDVELGDACMRNVGIAELGGEHAGQGEVGGVSPTAGHLVGPVGADETWLGCCRHARQYATSEPAWFHAAANLVGCGSSATIVRGE